MNFTCHNCGKLNSMPNMSVPPNQSARCYCQYCGAPNIVGNNENTQYSYDDNESTRYDMPASQPPVAPPPSYMPPRRPERKNGTSAVLYLVIGLAIAIVGVGVWWIVSNNSKPATEMTSQGDIESQQEDFVEDFYETCVFGTPTVRQVKKSCTSRMLGKVRESDTKFAMYKFLTGENQGAGKESGVKDVTSLGDNQVKVTYLDNGVKGVSIITLVDEDGEWKIDDVEYKADLSESSKPATVVKEEVKVVETDTYSFEGAVDGEYPITARLTFTRSGDGFTVKGKYAYLSTLKKYGDKKSSWINVSGRVDRFNRITWTESISNEPNYDSSLVGDIDSDLRNITGYVGEVGDHTFYLSR